MIDDDHQSEGQAPVCKDQVFSWPIFQRPPNEPRKATQDKQTDDRDAVVIDVEGELSLRAQKCFIDDVMA